MKWCGAYFGSGVGVTAIGIEADTLQPIGEAYERKARPVRGLPKKPYNCGFNRKYFKKILITIF
jgi:hypothetical protein